MKYYTQDHEWLRLDGNIATIGISDHAQDALGDIVFVDLPTVGNHVNAGEAVAVVESVKAAGDVNSPVAGEVIAINEALLDSPNLINSAPESDGWIFKLKINNPADVAGLMDNHAYQTFLG